MKKIRTVLLQIILTFGPIISRAQCDCLEPLPDIFHMDNSQFAYYKNIKSFFFEGYNFMPGGNFLILPSFEPECALEVSINKFENKYGLIYKIASENIWFSKNRKEIEIATNRKEIDLNTAELICTLFKTALSQAKYTDNHPVVPDGTGYYFSINNYGPISGGQVSTALEGSKMFQLVKIGIELMEFTRGNKTEIDSILLKEIESLQLEINDGR
jgi:hypothetical protein